MSHRTINSIPSQELSEILIQVNRETSINRGLSDLTKLLIKQPKHKIFLVDNNTFVKYFESLLYKNDIIDYLWDFYCENKKRHDDDCQKLIDKYLN